MMNHNQLEALCFAMATDDQVDRYKSLSKRQLEVTELAAKGYSTKEIGRILSCSHRTVEIHWYQALEKLQVPRIEVSLIFFRIEVRRLAQGGFL